MMLQKLITLHDMESVVGLLCVRIRRVQWADDFLQNWLNGGGTCLVSAVPLSGIHNPDNLY